MPFIGATLISSDVVGIAAARSGYRQKKAVRSRTHCTHCGRAARHRCDDSALAPRRGNGTAPGNEAGAAQPKRRTMVNCRDPSGQAYGAAWLAPGPQF